MHCLTKEQLLGATPPPPERVALPPSPNIPAGACVYVRRMTGDERDAWDAWLYDCSKQGGSAAYVGKTARLVAICATDEQGEQLFTPEDAAALGRIDGAVLDAIFRAADRLNKLSDATLDETIKNSEPALSDDSG